MAVINGTLQVPPASLIDLSWSSSWQNDPSLSIPLPAGKAFGITSRIAGNPESRLLSKITHYQDNALGYGVNDSAYNHLWRNLRGQGTDPAGVAGAFPNNLNFIAMAQMMEDGFSVAQAEQALQLCYQKLVNQFGITSPNQCGIHGDYFDGFMENTSVSVSFPRSPLETNVGARYTQLIDSVASQANARRPWNFNGGMESFTSDYFTQGYYLYRNWYIRGYLDNLKNTSDGSRSYELICNLNRHHMAVPDRHVLVYGWSSLEGVESLVNRAGVFPLLHFDSPSGDILRNGLVTAPHNLTMEDCFWTLLLGSRYVMWDVFTQYSNAQSDWFISRHGEEEHVRSTWKTQWRPATGQTQDYDFANQPKPNLTDAPVAYDDQGRRIYQAGRLIFPEVPRTADQGAACGAWHYSQVRNHCNVSITWPQFTYSTGGNFIDGYYNGQFPVAGSAGNARTSCYGFANYGEHNIIRQHQYQKPIVLNGVGTAGEMVAIKNSFVGPNQEHVYHLFKNGHNYDCVARGPGLHVFKIDLSGLS